MRPARLAIASGLCGGISATYLQRVYRTSRDCVKITKGGILQNAGLIRVTRLLLDPSQQWIVDGPPSRSRSLSEQSPRAGRTVRRDGPTMCAATLVHIPPPRSRRAAHALARPVCAALLPCDTSATLDHKCGGGAGAWGRRRCDGPGGAGGDPHIWRRRGRGGAAAQASGRRAISSPPSAPRAAARVTPGGSIGPLRPVGRAVHARGPSGSGKLDGGQQRHLHWIQLHLNKIIRKKLRRARGLPPMAAPRPVAPRRAFGGRRGARASRCCGQRCGRLGRVG
jgi:hypothetical protein